jgi:beta-alanine--pyruvate transaminase
MDGLDQLLIDFLPARQFAQEPLVLAQGEGIYVRDQNGKAYLDGLSGVFVSSLGHGNKALVAALVKQAEQLAFGAPIYSANTPALALAQRLLALAPGYGAVKLTAAGSEATEAAIKLARQYHALNGEPRRFKILSHYHGFHGATGHAMAASSNPAYRPAAEPLAPGFVKVHPPFALERRLHLRGSSAAAQAALALVEETIELEGAETIACFITEAVMLSAGVRIPPVEYLGRLTDLLSERGILLICDEIITGFGRTGRLFACEHFGLAPDILCFGKGISGGYAALAGLLIAEHVAEPFKKGTEAFLDGHTYGNNPLASAVGLAAIDQLIDGGLIDRATRLGERLLAAVVSAGHPAVTDVRGLGLLLGVELAVPGQQVWKAALERGLLIRRGPDFVALGPPLVATEDEIDEVASVLLRSIEAVWAERRAGIGPRSKARVQAQA